jgi:L-rhamnose-H+ transport protein
VETSALGFFIVCFSGIAGGAFAFPLRLKGVYAEENTLLGAYALALLIIPLIAASLALPFWPRVFRSIPARELLVPLLCGMGWGCAAVAYANGVSRIGLALTVSIVMSLTMAIGSVVPLLSKWASVAAEVRRWMLAGIAVCGTGVFLFGAAGLVRDRNRPRAAGGSFAAGVLWCLLSGLLSPLANVGFDRAAPIVDRAIALGGNAALSPLLAWFPTYCGGLLVMTAAFGARLLKRGTWRRYFASGSGTDLLRTGLMGVLHFLAQVPYGIGAYLLGFLGTSIGWAATLGSQLVAANTMGLVLGEWRGSPRACGRLIGIGLVVVLAAIVMLARASSLAAR